MLAKTKISQEKLSIQHHEKVSLAFRDQGIIELHD